MASASAWRVPTCVGVAEHNVELTHAASVVLECPSWLLLLAPQHHTLLSAFRAQTNEPPAPISTTSARPATGDGDALYVCGASAAMGCPSWPELLLPQQ